MAGAPGVQWLGWLSREALIAELRAARVLLFPSRWQEPFGILAVEALAQGTPVIAMESGGVSDWARAGTVLVERGDVKGMARALRELWQHPEEVKRLGQAGWEMVRACYDPADLQESWRALYARLSD